MKEEKDAKAKEVKTRKKEEEEKRGHASGKLVRLSPGVQQPPPGG
jgi:hypothetical protein